jgi:biotin operon repressor
MNSTPHPAPAPDAQAVSDEILRFALRQREDRIARFILRLTLGEGRRQVCIPRLDLFATPLGISRGNVCTALASLRRMGVIQVETKHNEPYYEVNSNSDQWICRSWAPKDQVVQARRLISAANPASTYQI